MQGKRVKVALSGFDLVSYYQNEKPLKGSKNNSLVFNGKNYRFSTEVNKKTFQNNPENYLPQYGGWCAYGMAVNGKLYKVNPRAYEIIEGNLYLFYRKSVFNYLKKWQSRDPQKLILQADKNWLKEQG